MHGTNLFPVMILLRRLSPVLLVLAMLLVAPSAQGAVVPISRSYDVQYAVREDGAVLSYHLLRPRKVTRPAPVVIMLHGGGWWRGSKNDLIEGRPIAQTFARNGFVTIAPDYRLSCGKPGSMRRILGYSFPGRSQLCGSTIEDQVTDVHDMVRYVRRNAKELGADPSRIALFGVSAGGHLALLSATRADRSASVRSVVNFSGPPSTGFVRLQQVRPSPGIRNIRASFSNAVGCLPVTCPTRWLQADPQRLTNRKTPKFATLSIVGETESQVPVYAYRSYHNHVRRLKRRSDMLVAQGSCHGAGCIFVRPVGHKQTTMHLMSNFIKATLR